MESLVRFNLQKRGEWGPPSHSSASCFVRFVHLLGRDGLVYGGLQPIVSDKGVVTFSILSSGGLKLDWFARRVAKHGRQGSAFVARREMSVVWHSLDMVQEERVESKSSPRT